MIRANRMALILHLGRELTDEEEACHSCDNPICCNPKHLFVGSHVENMKDYGDKGFAKGENHSRAKLSKSDFAKALSMRTQGFMVKDVATVFGISPSHMSRVLRGITGHSQLELS